MRNLNTLRCFAALLIFSGLTLLRSEMLSRPQSVTASPLKFEVASIKPAVLSEGPKGFGCHGTDSKLAPNDLRLAVPLGRCVITGRLSHAMTIAYSLPGQRIIGLPEWDNPSVFEIEARAEDPAAATEQQLHLMLQSLLADRFKLAIHREGKETPIFTLIAGKSPKLKTSSEVSKSLQFSGLSMVFKGYSMADLADFLTGLPSVGRPVHDMTNLGGRFDFILHILETAPKSEADLKMSLMNWQSTFSDIQEQLGLKLESSKASVEVLVIDHVEKPPNR